MHDENTFCPFVPCPIVPFVLCEAMIFRIRNQNGIL